jgi:hypothetical protein
MEENSNRTKDIINTKWTTIGNFVTYFIFVLIKLPRPYGCLSLLGNSYYLKKKETTYNIILKQELMSLQRLITNLIVTQNYGLLVRAAM